MLCQLSKQTVQLCEASFKGELEKVKSLLPGMSLDEINGKNSRGQTALYCAAYSGHVQVMYELLKMDGIDRDAQEPKGSTALHAASYGGHAKAVSLLLASGAQPDITKFPLQGRTRGLMAREEAQGQAREVWKIFQDGSLQALNKSQFAMTPPQRPINSASSPASVAGKQIVGIIPKITTIKYPRKLGRARLDQIEPEMKLKEGVFLMKHDNNNWKERGVIFFKMYDRFHIGTYKLEETTIETESILPKIEEENCIDPPFGLSINSSDAGAFFIKGVPAGLTENATELKELVFKPSTVEERQEWLTFLYKTCMPKERRIKRHDRESLTSKKDQDDYKTVWRGYAEKGLLANENLAKTGASNDINLLIKQIENITEDDVYYNSMEKLKSLCAGLPRGDQMRETLVWITKQPRPHDMDLLLDKEGESQVSRFRSQIEKLQKSNSTPSNVKNVLKKLDKIYLSYLNSKGAQPRPALLRSREAKIGSRIVPQIMAKRILDPSANTAEGVHRVVRVGNIFFKVNPTAPAYEMAVGELSRLIWKQGTALTLIVKIELGETAVVCQAAAAVNGLLLRDFISELPDLVKYLDYENLTVHFLAATLYRPLDGKLDNLIVRCEDHVGNPHFKKFVIVSIDSDECFGDEFILTNSKQHEISCRFSVWLLPQTKTSRNYAGLMNASACKMLLQHSPEYIVANFLIYLYRQNEKLYAMYDEGVITKEELLGDKETDRNPLISLFRPRETLRLLEDIRRAQSFVKEDIRVCSFQKFFRNMFPVMSQFYAYTSEMIAEDLSNFQKVIENELFGFGRPLMEKYTALLKKWPNMVEELKPYNNNSSAYIDERKARPEEELETLLDEIDFSKVPESDQTEILWDLVRLPLKRFTIRNSQAFSKKHLEDLLSQKVISVLTIEGCPKINNTVIHMLKIRCHQFASQHEVTVNVINCPNVRRLPPGDNTLVKIHVENNQKFAVELTRLSRFKQDLNTNPLIPPRIIELFTELSPLNATTPLDTPAGKTDPVSALQMELARSPLSSETKSFLMKLFLEHDIALEAIESGNLDLLRFQWHILGNSQFPEESIEGESLLQTAIDFIQDDIAFFLIENTKLLRYCSWEVLHQAIRSNMFKTAASIIYCDPSFLLNLDERGNDALLILCTTNGNEDSALELLKLTMKLNPNVHHSNNEGKSALHITVSLGNLRIVQFLIEEGFNINAKDLENQTPLSLALKVKQREVVEFLLLSRCQVDITHFIVAIQSQDTSLLDLLINKRSPPLGRLSTITDSVGHHCLFFVDQLSVAQYLVNKEPDLVHLPCKTGHTPTMWLASKLGEENGDFLSILRFFVKEHGANINALNSEGFSPLHLALWKKQGSAIKSGGTGAGTGGGSEAGTGSVGVGAKGTVEVVNNLLSLGADPSVELGLHDSKINILHIIIKTNNKLLVQTILQKLQTDHPAVLKAMFNRPYEDSANCYEYAKQYKNLDVMMCFKELQALYSTVPGGAGSGGAAGSGSAEAEAGAGAGAGTGAVAAAAAAAGTGSGSGSGSGAGSGSGVGAGGSTVEEYLTVYFPEGEKKTVILKQGLQQSLQKEQTLGDILQPILLQRGISGLDQIIVKDSKGKKIKLDSVKTSNMKGKDIYITKKKPSKQH